MRLTKNRKLIIDLFTLEKKPLSAEMIVKLLGSDKMDLSTIYRALDYFERNNILIKSVIEERSYYYLNKKDHKHYMICIKCLEMFQVDCLIKPMIEKIENEKGYTIIKHDLLLYGICDKCQKDG